MGEVGVHRDGEVGALRNRSAEPGDVGGAEAELALAVDHLDAPVVLRRQPVGDLAGAVGGGVVDDDHADVYGLGEQPLDERRDVLSFVIGWDDDAGGQGL